MYFSLHLHFLTTAEMADQLVAQENSRYRRKMYINDGGKHFLSPGRLDRKDVRKKIDAVYKEARSFDTFTKRKKCVQICYLLEHESLLYKFLLGLDISTHHTIVKNTTVFPLSKILSHFVRKPRFNLYRNCVTNSS